MTTATKTIWAVDEHHSTVQFKVKHLGISHVSGVFSRFEGRVESDADDFASAEVHFSVDVTSLDTHHPDRDGHLKSPEFFDAETFPRMSFDGSLVKQDGGYWLTGELTIRDTTRSIRMEAEATGTGPGRFGDKRAGFEVTGKINRKDFGLGWNMLTEAGGMVVGEEVRLHFDMELICQAG